MFSFSKGGKVRYQHGISNCAGSVSVSFAVVAVIFLTRKIKKKELAVIATMVLLAK